jgi:hypothetical protein
VNGNQIEIHISVMNRSGTKPGVPQKRAWFVYHFLRSSSLARDLIHHKMNKVEDKGELGPIYQLSNDRDRAKYLVTVRDGSLLQNILTTLPTSLEAVNIDHGEDVIKKSVFHHMDKILFKQATRIELTDCFIHCTR